MAVYEISFEDTQASKVYVVSKSRKNVVEDLKGAFGEDLNDRIRILTTEEANRFNFTNRRAANNAVNSGSAKTFMLSLPRKKR